jgi:hypothetical protein
MNTNPATPAVKIVTMPIGNDWPVRISDGRRLQFVSVFEAKSSAEAWVRNSSHAWLNKLRTIAEHL